METITAYEETLDAQEAKRFIFGEGLKRKCLPTGEFVPLQPTLPEECNDLDSSKLSPQYERCRAG